MVDRSRRLIAALLLVVFTTGGLGLPLTDALEFHRRLAQGPVAATPDHPVAQPESVAVAHERHCVLAASLGTRGVALSSGTPHLQPPDIDRSPLLAHPDQRRTSDVRAFPPSRGPPLLPA